MVPGLGHWEAPMQMKHSEVKPNLECLGCDVKKTCETIHLQWKRLCEGPCFSEKCEMTMFSRQIRWNVQRMERK